MILWCHKSKIDNSENNKARLYAGLYFSMIAKFCVIIGIGITLIMYITIILNMQFTNIWLIHNH